MAAQTSRGEGSKSGFLMSSLSEEAVDKGFAFIEAEAARLGSEWERIQWMTKTLHTNEESPIHQWPQGFVERCLRALQADGVLALPIEDFDFTLADVEFAALDFVVIHMIKSLRTHANGIVGGACSGTAPLAKIATFCASRYWKRQLRLDTSPSFREASEFVFFRGQAGRKDRPDIHDEGCLASEPICKMKGFADISCAGVRRNLSKDRCASSSAMTSL